MAQSEGTSAAPSTTEGLDQQTRVTLAFAAVNRIKDYGANVLQQVRSVSRRPRSERGDCVAQAVGGVAR